MEEEQLLRASFVLGQVYADLSFTPPYVAEMVRVDGVERVRGYNIVSAHMPSTPYFSQRTCRLRAQTVHEWLRLTGERLTNDLEPVANRTA